MNAFVCGCNNCLHIYTAKRFAIQRNANVEDVAVKFKQIKRVLHRNWKGSGADSDIRRNAAWLGFLRASNNNICPVTVCEMFTVRIFMTLTSTFRMGQDQM